MFEKIKKDLYFKKTHLLIRKGLSEGTIIPFDDDFYDQLSHTYFNCLPVSINIKYLKPILSPGKCDSRSLYMFFCFDDAILVRADVKNLELEYGKSRAFHGWIEKDGFVYDPTMLMRFDKDLYYKIFQPSNIVKSTKEEYCSLEGNKDYYDDVRNTTIEDFMPGGSKRLDLLNLVPLYKGISKASKNQEFIDDLNDFLTKIQYNEEEIYRQMQEKLGIGAIK